jgi:hypothetical protein
MCVCLVHEEYIQHGGETVHVVLKYCLSPEACCKKGWGRAECCLALTESTRVYPS